MKAAVHVSEEDGSVVPLERAVTRRRVTLKAIAVVIAIDLAVALGAFVVGRLTMHAASNEDATGNICSPGAPCAAPTLGSK